jgi:hypothetical protein
MKDVVLLLIAPLVLGYGLGTFSAQMHEKNKIGGWACFVLSIVFVFAYVYFAKL